MNYSTSILSNAQQVIFATVLTLAFLFAGCSDEFPTSPETSREVFQNHSLEGTWIALDQDGNKDNNNLLVLLGSSGFHQVNPNDSGNDKLYMEFLYKKMSNSILRITIIQHRVNGVSQPLEGQEDVFYNLDKDKLSILNQIFVRDKQ